MLFLPKTLFLDPNFVANDKQTTALIEDLYSKLDKRKKGVSNWKAAYGVLAGVLALREHGTFKVHKNYLSNEQYQIWEAIKESPLLGYLIQFLGGKGRNEYCVHPKFTTPSSVISVTKDTPFGYRVTGPGGVSYTSQSALQHPSQVSLLNGRHAVSCTIKSAQTAVQMCSDYGTPQEIPFPNSYLSLPPYPTDHPCSHEPIGNLVVEMWLDHLRKRMKQYQYIGVIPAHPSCNHDDFGSRDFNTIPIVLLADHAHEFTDWAYQVSLDFWRLHKLKAVTFPLHIHHKDWTQIVRGQPVQMLRERAAGAAG
jgi:hypothetical protein